MTDLPALLLFDLDGTLMLSHGAGVRAMDKVAHRLFGPDFHWEGILFGGNLDPLIFQQAAQINQLVPNDCEETLHRHHLQFRDAYLEQLAIELDEAGDDVQIMPGFPDLLYHLKEREQTRGDLVLGLLTGNYTQAVPIKLNAIGINVDMFSLTVFGDEVPDRPAMVKLALDRYTQQYGQRPPGYKVIVIGDTPRDVHCAAANNCASLAVATGKFSYDELAATDPTLVVEDLGDPGPLFSMLGEPASFRANA